MVSLTPESIPEDVQIGMISSINEEKQKKQVVVSKITKDNIFAKSRFKDYKSSIKIKSNIIKDINNIIPKTANKTKILKMMVICHL